MDFSLTTLFVVPASQTALPATSVKTNELTPGQVGFFDAKYDGFTTAPVTPYFYVAQGRQNTYLQASKRSDKIGIAGVVGGSQNVIEYYKVKGCPTPLNQITKVGAWHVGCGEDVTVTLRAHSSYIDTLYFNGFTRSVTVTAPCCACDGGDACEDVDVPKLIDQLIAKFLERAPGNNPDNINFSTYYSFRREGNDKNALLVITGKPLTKYGVPCDVAAFPFEYDRMWFRTFAYVGPATTADFIVADGCNVIAEPFVVQKSTYATGTSSEFAQLEKNFYSYQAGYLKALYRMAGYNQNFESYVSDGASYDSYYIKFSEYGKGNYDWGAYVPMDSTVIIAAIAGSAVSTAIDATLESALKYGIAVDNACPTTTSTTTSAPGPTTTTTTTLQP
jgi:hypothetical protein